VRVFSIRECEACVNVNLTLPVLPSARRVCACVNVNLTLPVLPSTETNKHNMRHDSKRLSRVCVCVNAKRV
jgi:hypothetical protein